MILFVNIDSTIDNRSNTPTNINDKRKNCWGNKILKTIKL